MRESSYSRERKSRLPLGTICASLSLLLVVGLISAAPAWASIEQVGHFADSGEGSQLEGSTALAVNTTGAGGVPAGTVYAVTGEHNSVVRYDPDGRFSEAWGWHVSVGGSEQFERCGPDGEPTHPHCTAEVPGSPGQGLGKAGEGAGQLGSPKGVAVNQQTGDVYVLNNTRFSGVIQVFTAEGTVLTSFGERKSLSVEETIQESPTKFHHSREGGLAVSSAGALYAIDETPETPSTSPEERIMVFENGTYTGQAHDIAPFPQGPRYILRGLALDNAGNLYARSETAIYEFSTVSPSAPICHYNFATGGISGVTVNPQTSEPYYFSYKTKKIQRLNSCNSNGEFTPKELIAATPKTDGNLGLAYNPTRAFSASRPDGILYAADPVYHAGETPSQDVRGIGDIFAPAEVHPPSVESESFDHVTASTASLKASIDPHGFPVSYRFQYLSEEAYEANQPNERHSLTVSATGGVFGLGFEGREFGGAARADLTAGSAVAANLTTAKGHADVHAAGGTATLAGAVGTGTVISGSNTVTAVSTTVGAFNAGQGIKGEGIPLGTTITAVAGNELTLSAPATKSVANVDIKAGTSTLTSLSTSEGTFEVGERITGAGIPSGATITAATPTQLTLSQPVEGAGAGVGISAGSTTLTGAVATEGSFEVGTPISGEGIPSGTTITAVHAGSLQISQAPTKPGSAVTIFSTGPAPLAVGEIVEGPGIPTGTTITAVQAGELTLSAPAESTVAAAHLRAGLPWSATSHQVQRALEALPTIGGGNVSVSGGPGDEAGSSPYEVEFTGSLGNQDLPELEADSSGLTGGSSSASVAVVNDGGEGFAHGALEAPLGGGKIEGSGATVAAAGVSSLAPGTRYRFRVVVASECEGEGLPLCEVEGMTASFVTFAKAGSSLPDGRAYELVSPRSKSGGEVFPLNPEVGSCEVFVECKPGALGQFFPKLSSQAGDAVVYEGQPFSPTEGANVYNEYLSKRMPTGWQTTPLAPTLMGSNGQGYKGFDADLTKGVLYQLTPSLTAGAPSEIPNLYTQSTGDPTELAPLVGGIPANHTDGHGFTLSFAGASTDFSRLFFAADDALTGPTDVAPEAVYEGNQKKNLYESTGGGLRLVNVLPGNTQTVPGAHFGAAPLHVTNSSDSVSDLSHAISGDGSRVFWSDEAGQVYVREDGDTTVEINDPGKFLTATADGSKVLLRDGCLYSLAAGECEDLTKDESGVHQGGFLGIVGQSEDLSRIYFVDSNALTGGNAEGKVPNEHRSGENNLYAWHKGAVAFVATLAAADNEGAGEGEGIGDWIFSPAQRTAQASPDGRWLAFTSSAQLTGYDNVGPACARETIGGVSQLVTGRCREVFLYDAEGGSGQGKLLCPSCNPSGEVPLGPSRVPLVIQGGGSEDPLEQPRYLTSQGRLYFDSRDSLTPFDTNGRIEDAYQYESVGIGSCNRAAGCVDLISKGTGSDDSDFLAVDSSGGNVFFTTRDQLVLSDRDALIDLYDAREGGGLLADNEGGRIECQGEACQPPPSSPSVVTPGSSSFEGTGNVKEKKHAKKHKKKHAKKRKHAKKHSRGGAR